MRAPAYRPYLSSASKGLQRLKCSRDQPPPVTEPGYLNLSGAQDAPTPRRLFLHRPFSNPRHFFSFCKRKSSLGRSKTRSHILWQCLKHRKLEIASTGHCHMLLHSPRRAAAPTPYQRLLHQKRLMLRKTRLKMTPNMTLLQKGSKLREKSAGPATLRHIQPVIALTRTDLTPIMPLRPRKHGITSLRCFIQAQPTGTQRDLLIESEKVASWACDPCNHFCTAATHTCASNSSKEN